MGGNQISTQTAQSSFKVKVAPCELVMVIWQDGQVIGKVTTTQEELAGNEFLGEAKVKKAEIRSFLRSFYFDNLDNGAQRTKSLALTSGQPSPLLRIRVRTLTGKTVHITCHSTDTIEMVKELVPMNEGIPPNQQRLAYGGLQLEDSSTLSAYKIPNDAVLHLVVPFRGGPAACQLPVDLFNQFVKVGKGVTDCEHWEGYLKGFNILGSCTSSNCISKGRQVCVKLGYPKQLILTDSKNIQKCPACHESPITIRAYLVAVCRAKITLRNSSCVEAETLFLESSCNDVGEFTKMKKREGIEYVQVTTTELGMFFNNCQLCNQGMKMSEEQMVPCGRAFHKKCLSDNGGCPICELPEFKLSQLPGLVASRSDKFLRMTVPNHLFGKCSSARTPGDGKNDGGEAKHIDGFVQDVISMQFESRGNSKIPTAELQQNFILTNLPYLIKNTEVTDKVLARLRERGILSQTEQTRLKCINDDVEKCRQLYKIVPTRPEGMAGLITILAETHQHRAAAVLSVFLGRFNK